MDLLLEQTDEGQLRLASPEVGELTDAPAKGEALAPGQRAGVLLHLGRAIELRVPAGAGGLVVSTRPERVHAPVGYGDTVALLDPAGIAAAELEAEDGPESADGLVLRADQTGRFYHRASPDDPPFVGPGDLVEDGTPVGLIEVMKTYRHVVYRATGALPTRGRVVRVLAADASDVESGTPLVEVEPA